MAAAAAQTGTKIFFADEAHFQADAELRGKGVLKGEPAWWIPPAHDVGRGSAVTRRSAWKPERWK